MSELDYSTASLWVKFAAAALAYAGNTPVSAADVADKMLKEFEKRFEWDAAYEDWAEKEYD